MDVLTLSDARAQLGSVMDRVTRGGEEIVVARRGGASVVIVSLEDWNSIQETFHLLSALTNARVLRRSIAQLDAGRGTDDHPDRR